MKRLKRGMDIEMNLAEFNVLYEVYKEGSVIYQNIVRNTGYESEQVSKVIEGLREKGWIESGITKKGYEELEQYRVDNAIIMAAGFGIRSLPLSRVVPKGLFEVKGEVLIERQIRLSGFRVKQWYPARKSPPSASKNNTSCFLP